MGNRIRDLRIEKKMSQEELSAKSGVSRTTISNIENGEEKNVLMSTLLRIATALETTVDNLISR